MLLRPAAPWNVLWAGHQADLLWQGGLLLAVQQAARLVCLLSRALPAPQHPAAACLHLTPSSRSPCTQSNWASMLGGSQWKP